MTVNTTLARRIFEGKYPYEMPFHSYLGFLEKGFELIEQKAIDAYNDLNELKAIRIALEYRLEVVRQFRKKQIKNALGTVANFASMA